MLLALLSSARTIKLHTALKTTDCLTFWIKLLDLYYNKKNSYSLDYYVFKQPNYPICLNLRIHLHGCMITLLGCVLLRWAQLGWS